MAFDMVVMRHTWQLTDNQLYDELEQRERSRQGESDARVRKFAAAGSAISAVSVRHPVVVERGQTNRVAVALAAASSLSSPDDHHHSPTPSPLSPVASSVGTGRRGAPVLIGPPGPNDELDRLALAFTGNSSTPYSRLVTCIPEDTSALRNALVRTDAVVHIPVAGGGSVDPSLVQLLASHDGPVVYINISPSDAGMTSNEAADAAAVEESLIAASRYELVVGDEGVGGGLATNDAWEALVWELRRMLALHARGRAVIGGESSWRDLGKQTFLLCLTYKDVVEGAAAAQQLSKDADAVELRVDLLEGITSCTDGGSASGARPSVSGDTRRTVLRQGMLLRRMLRPHTRRAPVLRSPASLAVMDDAVPLVWTVRTRGQAGTFPDDEAGIASMFDLLELGLRAGVEWLDVESAWDPTRTDALLAAAERDYAGTQILGSHHEVGRETPADDAVALFKQCHFDGRAHGVKMVLSCFDEANAADVHAAAAAANLPVPYIAIALGEEGQRARVINERLTPVTHDALPAKAAPGQLTAEELMRARADGEGEARLVPLRHCILGHNISYSVSPQMHNAAFAACGLPHTYERADLADVADFVDGELFNAPNFGGASVTIPHKQAIMAHVDELDDAARAIGAVNTIVVVDRGDESAGAGSGSSPGSSPPGRRLRGCNTDWLGIYRSLERHFADGGAFGPGGGAGSNEKRFALIVGGGGTARAAAYAARTLDLELIFYNRTRAKAEELAAAFGGAVVDDLESETLLAVTGRTGFVRLVLSTIPAAANFTVPGYLLAADDGRSPVVMDVVYKPFETSLLRQAASAGCPVVRGSEMLWEQGVEQFELWTGRRAPYGVMRDVVLRDCGGIEGEQS